MSTGVPEGYLTHRLFAYQPPAAKATTATTAGIAATV